MALAPEEIGSRIAAARKAKGWTHEELARRIGERLERQTGLRTVQRWQKGRDPATGKSWLPRLATLMELADLFEVPRSWFVEDEPHEDASLPHLISRLERSVQRAESVAARLERAQGARPTR